MTAVVTVAVTVAVNDESYCFEYKNSSKLN